jgi:hypothetical protein
MEPTDHTRLYLQEHLLSREIDNEHADRLLTGTYSEDVECPISTLSVETRDESSENEMYLLFAADLLACFLLIGLWVWPAILLHSFARSLTLEGFYSAVIFGNGFMLAMLWYIKRTRNKKLTILDVLPTPLFLILVYIDNGTMEIVLIAIAFTLLCKHFYDHGCHCMATVSGRFDLFKQMRDDYFDRIQEEEEYQLEELQAQIDRFAHLEALRRESNVVPGTKMIRPVKVLLVLSFLVLVWGLILFYGLFSDF